MTSSLVGSEMCIRDRLNGEKPPAGNRVWPPVPRKGQPPGEVASTDRPLPVSYTHLTLPTICSV
eukprot:179202-Prorocentrum_lima.AAC.1